MSLSTSLPRIEPSTQPAPPIGRIKRRRRRTGRRVLLAVGLALVLTVGGIGGYIAYENTLPTTFATNFRDGQKDVPTDSRVLISFTRPVLPSTVQAAFSISPATDGAITAISDNTQYAWTPAKPLAELTTYTATLKAILDVGHHRVQGTTWSFTTIIVPHVSSVTGAGGVALNNGDEVDPGTVLTLNFNDAMNPATVAILIGTKPATLKWAADDRSATLSTVGVPTGPLALQMAAGGRDQTGHAVPLAFSLHSGIYYHDHEHTTPLKYPALIQVPNDQNAVDQNGLQAANIVFEYLAEGGITRLTAIFQNVPDLIGPMRSARFISLKLGRHYKGLLFQSGESAATAARDRQDPTPQFFDVNGYQFRTPARIAPDNLMIHGASVRAAEVNYFGGISAYTLPTARPVMPPATSGASSVTVDEHYSVYTYDPVMGTYGKTEAGHFYRDATSKQPLRIEMLIVLHTQEQLLNVGDGHGAHIHDYNIDSSGLFNVYYKGQSWKGTWKSVNSHAPLVFTLSDGTALSLPPGLVWIDVTQ
ncbi:MAG TPA: DUF3048 domain-containing protein [Candidatus Dormibacteraeota bacterium]|nr:DUF3048 domain-containing protein [Candidatus Dormibacteraeota bacterium]